MKRLLVIEVELIGPNVEGIDREIILSHVTEGVVDAFDTLPAEPGTTDAIVYQGRLVSDEVTP